MSKFFGICAAEPTFFVDIAPFGMAPPNPMNRGMACFGLKGKPRDNSLRFALQNPRGFYMAPWEWLLPNARNCGMACFGLKRKQCQHSLGFAVRTQGFSDMAPPGFGSGESRELRRGLLWDEEKAMSNFIGGCAAEPKGF